MRTKNVLKHIHAVVYFFRKIPIDQTKLSKEEIERIHEVVSAEVVSESYVEGCIKKTINKGIQLRPKLQEIQDLQVLKTVDSQLSKMWSIGC